MINSLRPKTLLIGVAAILVLVILAPWIGRTFASEEATYHARPRAVMGTDCLLVVLVNEGEAELATRALQEGEAVLRRAEALLSTWIESSEMGRLNAAPAGELVPLSPDSLEVLRAAKKAYLDSGGCFDVTCRPLIEVWRAAGQSGVLPEDAALEEAREASRWDHFELLESGARKTKASARVDLGGIAKGWAIDRALERMLAQEGVLGAIVEVGGDLARAGKRMVLDELRGPTGGRAIPSWAVRIQDPWGGDSPGWLVGRRREQPTGICTSGNYARFSRIGGRRYSHILDPRTLRPAESYPSVTVLGASAMEADVWATALSVGGADLLRREAFPKGLKIVAITGTKEAPVVRTRGAPGRVLFRPAREGLAIKPLRAR